MHTRIRPVIWMAFTAAVALSGCVQPTPDAAPAEPAETTEKPATREATTPSSQSGRAGTLPGRVTRIALGDLFALQQSGNVLIYDVRPAFFHSLGNIPGSVNWPKSAFNRQLASREAEIRAAAAAGKPVVLYCTDLACPDARDVATWLAERGHHTSVLEGGWDAWKVGGLPGS